MPLLERKFINLKGELKPDDFKEIAKITVTYIPTHAKNPVDVDSMPESKLAEITEAVYQDFLKRRKLPDSAYVE